VGVLTQHLMEPNKYASWTLLPGYGLLVALTVICGRGRVVKDGEGLGVFIM